MEFVDPFLCVSVCVLLISLRFQMILINEEGFDDIGCNADLYK